MLAVSSLRNVISFTHRILEHNVCGWVDWGRCTVCTPAHSATWNSVTRGRRHHSPLFHLFIHSSAAAAASHLLHSVGDHLFNSVMVSHNTPDKSTLAKHDELALPYAHTIQSTARLTVALTHSQIAGNLQGQDTNCDFYKFTRRTRPCVRRWRVSSRRP